MMKLLILATALAVATAECPNACSGHGTCGAYDMCTCYRNFQSADCSERTCPFNNAHVETAKGNLDGSSHNLLGRGATTGANLAAGNTGGANPEYQGEMLFSSTVYPVGTSESIDFDGPVKSLAAATGASAHVYVQDNGHHYMECSNKGLCDRKTGECECFEGYEGTACQRASCPNDCSSHGTCETIQELAEDRQWGDTTGMLGSTTTLHQFGGYSDTHVGSESTATGSFRGTNQDQKAQNRLTRGTYTNGGVPYFLWDRRATMGCKCDPVYFGADCSLRRCKYGIDPLYTGGMGTVTTEKTTVGIIVSGLDTALIATSPAPAAAYAAKFDITFYDVFGEDYTYYDVTASAGVSIVTADTVTVNDANAPVTSCSSITSVFPNDMLADTSTNKPFCSLTLYKSCNGGTAGTDRGLICGGAVMTAYKDLNTAGALTETATWKPDAAESPTAAHPEWTFDYNTGNPGFIKDIRINNLRDAREEIAVGNAAAAVGTVDVAITYYQPTFYMKKHNDGEWSDLVTTTSFDFYLPGYIQYLPTDSSSGTIAYHSENLGYYLAATATASKSDALTSTASSAVTSATVSAISEAWTMGLTPLDYPKTAADTGWNTFKSASKLTLSAGLSATSAFFDTDGDTDGTCADVLLLAADTELLKTKLKLNFEYVSMCSNRGKCDTDSGLCKCFSGYTNDNCDTQTSIV